MAGSVEPVSDTGNIAAAIQRAMVVVCHGYHRKEAPVSQISAPVAVTSRINVSMVSLKWGEVLSTLLPGTVAVYAIAPYFPALHARVTDIDKIGFEGGLVLLIVSALAGGVLEAVNRISWERILIKLCPSADALSGLTPENMELYERGVQSSYKYCTFYSNFALAIVLLIARRIDYAWRLKVVTLGAEMFILAGTALVLFYASYVQWKYFVNYMRKIFCRERTSYAAE
jgi:hypothetical protein